MERCEIQAYFQEIIKNDRDVSVGVAAIQTLLKVLERCKAATIQELDVNLRQAVEGMRQTEQPITAVSSGCELFLRFITFAQLDSVPFAECKEIMLKRGEVFIDRLLASRNKIAVEASRFIVDGCKILLHSKSRVVLQTILEAAKSHKRFEVFVTVSSPNNEGEEMYKLLLKESVDCTLVLDASIGYIMEQVDIVMLGAEGVVESGGIINKIGTYTVAMCAKELKKPVYVLTESFKFTRLYPLNQRDLPNEFKFLSSTRDNNSDLSKEHPLVDYTPPAYITLLFTDLGILTPSAVSDELIKLYL